MNEQVSNNSGQVLKIRRISCGTWPRSTFPRFIEFSMSLRAPVFSSCVVKAVPHELLYAYLLRRGCGCAPGHALGHQLRRLRSPCSTSCSGNHTCDICLRCTFSLSLYMYIPSLSLSLLSSLSLSLYLSLSIYVSLSLSLSFYPSLYISR